MHQFIQLLVSGLFGILLGYCLMLPLKRRIERLVSLYDKQSALVDQTQELADTYHHMWLSAVAELWAARALQRDTSQEQDAMATELAKRYQAEADELASKLGKNQGHDL